MQAGGAQTACPSCRSLLAAPLVYFSAACRAERRKWSQPPFWLFGKLPFTQDKVGPDPNTFDLSAKGERLVGDKVTLKTSSRMRFECFVGYASRTGIDGVIWDHVDTEYAASPSSSLS